MGMGATSKMSGCLLMETNEAMSGAQKATDDIVSKHLQRKG